MFGSENDFFFQEVKQLKIARQHLVNLCLIRRTTKQSTQEYLKAFDYFIQNPDSFDGATIVKDSIDIRTLKGYLDIDAMLHDYDYITGANMSFSKKYKADLKYIKNLEKNGKGIRLFRMFLLTISGIFFIPYKHIIK